MKRSLLAVMAVFALLGALSLSVAAVAGAHGGKHGKHHGWHGKHHWLARQARRRRRRQAGRVDPGRGERRRAGRHDLRQARHLRRERRHHQGRHHAAREAARRSCRPESPAPNDCSFGEPAGDGICAVGTLEFPQDGPPTVTDPVSDVTISGFKVEGFSANGILFFGAEDPVVKHNRTKDNHEYGIARFVSSGGKIVGNAASGSEEAGIYVGDSPEADVLIAGNWTFDNELFGIFLRDAAHGHVVANRSSGNCVGAIVLNTGANVAGDWRFAANKIHDNDRFCPGNEEEGTPPLSGIGVLIANAADNVLVGNWIKDNNPGGEVPFTGGVAIVNAGIPGANPPSGNLVKGNVDPRQRARPVLGRQRRGQRRSSATAVRRACRMGSARARAGRATTSAMGTATVGAATTATTIMTATTTRTTIAGTEPALGCVT